MKEKTYETPLSTEIEMIVEQPVLTASGEPGAYPAYSDELDLGW